MQITQNDPTNMFSFAAYLVVESAPGCARTENWASNPAGQQDTRNHRVWSMFDAYIDSVPCAHTVYTKLMHYATLMTVVHRVLSSIYDVGLANSTLHSYSSLEKRTLKPIIIIFNSISLFPNWSLNTFHIIFISLRDGKIKVKHLQKAEVKCILHCN